jgi:ADP-L-glycero-D-manno-heptose 6-epimerase
MKCLVTGGAGFIGSNVALKLQELGHDVTVVDNFFTGHVDNLAGFNGKVTRADVSRSFETAGDFDVIFHQAAITDPRHPDDDETYRSNTEGFEVIIDLADRCGAKLIYASSASLYGHGDPPQQEDQPKDLLNTYARSKLWMDDRARTLFDRMHVVGLRYFNVFGPREAHKGRPASMVYHLTRQMKRGDRPKLFRHGEQKRDHIYVADVVTANLLALEAPCGVYNVGTGRATAFNELVEWINEALGTDLVPEYIENPYGDTYQAHTQADTTRAREQLGFEAAFTPREGVHEYVHRLTS